MLTAALKKTANSLVYARVAHARVNAPPLAQYSTRGSEAWRDFGRRHIAAGVGRLSELVLSEGSGCWVSDVDGNKYLDFTSGIG
jgi:4-aminobutyrate aminotransferase-like enzyme